MKSERALTAGAASAILLGTAFLFLGLLGCSDNKDRRNFSYLRQATDFGVDEAPADEGCADSSGVFASVDECLRTRKFILHWERPEDTVGFLGYRIFLDTLHDANGTRMSWDNIQKSDRNAAVIVTDASKAKDKLVFFLTKGNARQDTLGPGPRHILAIDTTPHPQDSLGRFMFALVTRYADSKTQGQPRITPLITRDIFPPNPFSPVFTPGAKEIAIAWERPLDPVSIFNSGLDSGTILRYVLSIKLGGKGFKERSKTFDPKLTYVVGGADRTGEMTDTVVHSPDISKSPYGRNFFLPDGDHAHKLGGFGPRDSIKVLISNLTPKDTLVLNLFAIDSAGNGNSQSMQEVTVHTTDTTQPSRPYFLPPDSAAILANRFTLAWMASRDSADPRGDKPNFWIQSYHLSRRLLRDTSERVSPTDRIDSELIVSPENDTTSVFRITFNFLPPATHYRMTVFAVDSSGFQSVMDSIDITTRAIRFPGAESLFTCPPGFIPIPAHAFVLGDTSQASVAQGDEPQRKLFMKSYCIEPYEHRDSSGGVDSVGRFVSGVTWQQADSICRDMSPADGSSLCSEAEWERACEGFDSIPHPHGIQSESSPSILQTSCNEGTGDAEMAFNLALRNSVCLTNEGVYDMAGNLSEWVRDPYVGSAYAQLKDNDTLGHEFTFALPDSLAPGMSRDTLRGFRGWSYLKPPASVPLVLTQNLARCSNRDFAEQTRPRYRDDCIDSTEQKIAVVYGEGLNGHFCLPIEAGLKGKIKDLAPAKDSTKLVAFLENGTATIDLSGHYPKGDSVFLRLRPQSAQLTTPSVAQVTFVKAGGEEVVDFLDAREMRDSSQAALARIFNREVVSSQWSVKRVDGRYDIRLWYAYVISGSKPAKAYYASRALGFRCCSRTRPNATTKITARR